MCCKNERYFEYAESCYWFGLLGIGWKRGGRVVFCGFWVGRNPVRNGTRAKNTRKIFENKRKKTCPAIILQLYGNLDEFLRDFINNNCEMQQLCHKPHVLLVDITGLVQRN